MGEIKVDLLCEERVIRANHSGHRFDVEAKASIPDWNSSPSGGRGSHGDLFNSAFLSGERLVATLNDVVRKLMKLRQGRKLNLDLC